jgi:hypothetical protein
VQGAEPPAWTEQGIIRFAKKALDFIKREVGFIRREVGFEKRRVVDSKEE